MPDRVANRALPHAPQSGLLTSSRTGTAAIPVRVVSVPARSWGDYVLSAVPVAVAILGWYATNALAARARRRQFRLEVLNNARIAVADGIRRAQVWLASMVGGTAVPSMFLRAAPPGSPVPWLQAAGEMAGPIGAAAVQASQWIMRLEEYEALFPGTAAVRRELMDGQQALLRVYAAVVHAVQCARLIPVGNDTWHGAFLDTCDVLRARTSEHANLMQDLLDHVQDIGLSPIIKTPAAARVPPERLGARVERNPDGSLSIQGWSAGPGLEDLEAFAQEFIAWAQQPRASSAAFTRAAPGQRGSPQ